MCPFQNFEDKSVPSIGRIPFRVFVRSQISQSTGSKPLSVRIKGVENQTIAFRLTLAA